MLIATDAAGEGINLQRAHLMVNYDLPWNPNRLEQRFGRIHRIGQTEVCHLWNLVADETREGEVFHGCSRSWSRSARRWGARSSTSWARSLRQPAPAGTAPGGHPLRRPARGPRPAAPGRRQRARPRAPAALLEERPWPSEAMDARKVRQIREEMERAEARRLQPHFIAAFFLEAFELLGGSLKEREPKRYEITHVPAVIRKRDRQIGDRQAGPEPVRADHVREGADQPCPGKPLAEFVCPGHPAAGRDDRPRAGTEPRPPARGAVLVDPADAGRERPRALLPGTHHPGRPDGCSGTRRVVSRQLQFVEMDRPGPRPAGYAPYLDYRPADGGRTARRAASGAALAERAIWKSKVARPTPSRTLFRGTWTKCASARKS